MIDIKVPLPDGYGTMHWGMKDDVAIALAETILRATSGEDNILRTPMGVFEFRHVEKDGDYCIPGISCSNLMRERIE